MDVPKPRLPKPRPQTSSEIGYAHANFIRRNPRLELAAAADINPENLAAFQEKFEVAEGFGDYREMLEKARPDVVSICTYLGLHAEMVPACAEAGVKGVFLEKPALPQLRRDRIDLPMDEAALALDEWPLETLARKKSS